jgi:diguanylate cyclase (GGDEF)-like protein
LLTKLKSWFFPQCSANSIIKETLRSGQQVVLIYLDVVQFTKFKTFYGIEKCNKILNLCKQVILTADSFPADSFLTMHQAVDDFSIFMINSHQNTKQVISLIHSIAAEISTRIAVAYPDLEPVVFHKGFALLHYDPENNFDSMLYNAAKEAYKMAKISSGIEQAEYYYEFLEIIKSKAIVSFFQPIVSLQTATILGWEALTRGPANHYFYPPNVLFPFAETTGFLYQLEKIARESAVTSVSKLGFPANNKLFININPEILNDPEFVGGQTRALLNSLNISPANIVIEITERTCIKDFHIFRKTLTHYRNQGYLIAIDDAGAGYSSLQSIAEIKPDYIKIDLSLVRDIHNSPVKQTLLETFVNFSQKINSYLIAEGVEKAEELETLIKLGVNYGQGFLLAKPNNILEPISEKMVEHIILAQHNKEEHLYSLNIPISYLCVDTKCYSPQITAREVVDYFHNNPDTHGVVILKDQTPIGLVMREGLNAIMASHYGKSLYIDKPIANIMHSNPLIIDSSTPLDVAAQLAMQRNYAKANDYLIITHDHQYLGIVSVSSMILQLSKLNEQKVELAYAANPLSGLPGNITIQQQLDVRLKAGAQIAIIYADLDKFKTYNDSYGFENGDQVLRFTASVICQATAQYPSQDNFVGHIGGDDFLIIAKPELAEPICEKIIQLFDQEIPTFYDHESPHESPNADANIDNNSIMTISLAIVENQPPQFISYLELAKVAAQLKGLVKKQPGSNFIKNRRFN